MPRGRPKLYTEEERKQRHRERALKYYHANKEAHDDHSYRRRYGITKEDYDVMKEQQDGTCAICYKVGARALAVDHCHTTGKVRGLLCSNCNTAIGLLEEDKERIKKVIAYLENHD